MKRWREWVVITMALLATGNAVLRFWGDWYTFIVILLIGHLYICVYGGVYAYLFNKRMFGKFGSIDYKVNDTGIGAARSLGFYMYILIYIALFFYKTN